MTEQIEDPWSAHVCRFGVTGAHVTGTQPDGSILVRHGLDLIVEEGRYETLMDDGAGKPAPSVLAYGCFVTLAGAAEADSWSGIDMQVVITGKHQNGWHITIAGAGAVGNNASGSLEIHFETPPSTAVYEEDQ